MAQLTGSDILNLARIWSLDNDTVNSNYAVSATNALTLLNDVLVRYTNNVRAKFIYVSSSGSGFVFNPGQVEITSLTYASFAQFDILAAYPSNDSSSVDKLTPPLQRITVEEMKSLINDAAEVGTVQPGNSTEWLFYAIEEPSGSPGGGPWRAYVWPPVSRTRHLLLKCMPVVKLALIGDTPDMNELDASYVARFLAADMLAIQRVDTEVIQRVLSMVPLWIRNAMMESTVKEQGKQTHQNRSQYISGEA